MNILTSFPFTFKLTVPGLSNPFTSLAGNTPSPTSSSKQPASSTEPSFERPTRSLRRPLRPLPISVTAASPMAIPGPRGVHHRPSPVFSPSPSPTPSTSLSLSHTYSHLGPRPHFTQSHSPSPAPLNRKRGWEPSCSPTISETTLANTTGWLEAPEKREFAGGMERMHVPELQQIEGVRELDDDDLPPTKRRRGLAGSIVSTAWSAALIGTAVGLTVYKLWRGRGGKSEEEGQSSTEPYHADGNKYDDVLMIDTPPEPSSPPPPYNQEWTSIDYPAQHQHQQHLTPHARESKGKQRLTPRSTRRVIPARTHARRAERVVLPKSRGGTIGRSAGASNQSRPQIPSEFDFEGSPQKRGRMMGTEPRDAEMAQEDEVDDKMDWIGGKLAQLIEEGKKALGKEVVVMSDAKEDEEDDGSGAWVSDEERDRRGSLRRSGSTRSRRSMTFSGAPAPSSNFGLAPPSQPSRSASPTKPPGPPPPSKIPVPTTPQRRTRGLSHGGMGSPATSSNVATTSVISADDDLSTYESPEMREMMERARAKFNARMGR